MIDNFQYLILGNIAMAYDQCVGILRMVVLQKQLLILLANPVLCFPLLCHILINRINPRFSILVFDQGNIVFDPYIAAVPSSEPVYDFAMFSPGNIGVHLLIHIFPIFRMDPRHGIIPVQLP